MKKKVKNNLDIVAGEVAEIFKDPEFQQKMKELNNKWAREENNKWHEEFMRMESLHKLLHNKYGK